MKFDEIKKRLVLLEQRASPQELFCIVKFPDGTEKEVVVFDWLEHREDWELVRFTEWKTIPPAFPILLRLTDQAISKAIKNGADPSDPDLISLIAENNYYLENIEKGGI